MGSLKPVKQWIEHRQNNYKPATGDYLSTLSESIDRDTKEKLRKLKSRSIVVEISKSLLEGAANSIDGLTISRLSLPDAREGQRIQLNHRVDTNAGKNLASGYITRVNAGEVRIKLDQPLKDGGEFTIEMDDSEILERKKRVESCLWRLKDLTCSISIHKCLLGHYDDSSNNKHSSARVFCLKDLDQPKGRQVDVVEQALKKRIFLVEGAAGSGKTLVAANIACSMTRLRKAKILVCSPIQATVNKIARLISATNCIQVVQMPTRDNQPLKYDRYLSEEVGHSESVRCNLDTLVAEAVYEGALERFRGLSEYETPKEMELNERRAIKVVANCSTWLRRKHERRILMNADIVCCSLLQAGSPILKAIKFDMLIIDDAHMASELDCIVPMMAKGLKQVTLLGEMRRNILLARSTGQQIQQDEVEELYEEIGPDSRRSKTIVRRRKRILGRAENANQIREPGGLFERWLLMGLTSMALKYQYRMHQSIASFPNYHFYLSRLKSDKANNEELIQRINKEFKEGEESKFDWLPRKKCLTALFNRQQNENNDIYSTVRDIIKKLDAWESSIAIICNIPALSTGVSFHGAQVGQVDNFYGQERDYIIVLALESDEDKENNNNNTLFDSNFLRNDLALNVALTRAQLGLFIVADLTKLIPLNSDRPDTDTSTSNYCKSWIELVKHYSTNKLIVN